jgi:hypothetical protein
MMGIGRRPKHARANGRLSVAVVSLLAVAGTTTFGALAALSPAPAAAAATVAPDGGEALNAVSCTSVVSCMAVGNYGNSDPSDGTFNQNYAEVYNGINWQSASPTSPVLHTGLLGVSCVSGSSFCAAVGIDTVWTTTGGTSPIVAGPTGVLDAVSCPSATFCMATGSIGGGPLVEQWNGSTWSVVPSPATTSANAVLDGVSCTSPSSCEAVGSTGGSVNQTLAEQWNGTTWSIVPSPNTSNTVNNSLAAISCPSPTACIAVGSASSGALTGQTLIEQWNGSAWSIVASPNPAVAAGASELNQLNGVSCPSPTACTAVGQTTSTPTSGPATSQNLVEQSNGTTWSIVTSGNASTGSGLNSVSCVLATLCLAFGDNDFPGWASAGTFASYGGDSGPIANTGPVTVTGLSPVSGPSAGGTPITITGTGLTGTELVTFANGSLATNIVVVNDTTITAVTPSGPANGNEGFVRVTTPLGTSPPAASSPQFTWLASATGSAPTITSLSPTSGPTTGGTLVTVKGTGFNGATQVFFGSVPSTSFSVSSSTSLTAAAPAEAAGVHDVTVTTANGTSAVVAADRFTSVTPPPPPAPTVTSVSPSSGPSAGGTTVTVKGTGFNGATKVLFGSVPASSFSVSSSTKITAVSPAEAAGAHDVTITTPSGTSSAVTADQFTSVAPPPAPVPTVTSISPTSGPTTGGTSVTIKGTGFNGATQVLFGTVPASSFSVSSSTRISAVAPAQGAGWHNVFVTTPGGASVAVTADQFTYVLTPPVVSSLSPSSGPKAGGTTTTIRGTGFSGATQVLFGTVPATSFTVTSSTRITAVAPAGTGTVDVVVNTPNGTSTTSDDDQFNYNNRSR